MLFYVNSIKIIINHLALRDLARYSQSVEQKQWRGGRIMISVFFASGGDRVD